MLKLTLSIVWHKATPTGIELTTIHNAVDNWSVRQACERLAKSKKLLCRYTILLQL